MYLLLSVIKVGVAENFLGTWEYKIAEGIEVDQEIDKIPIRRGEACIIYHNPAHIQKQSQRGVL